MRDNSQIGAIILAAGRSSRMGASKPLLRLGNSTALERVVGSAEKAEIADRVVVVGHESQRVAAALPDLSARWVHNPEYDTGMFSSIQKGAAALRADTEAFFVLPVDCPLVGHWVLAHMKLEHRPRGRGVLHPVCCGLRGHPPLISGTLKGALIHADRRDDLGSFLSRLAADEDEVEMSDLSILMDMDTSEDYSRMARFAAFIDAAGVDVIAPSAPARSATPSWEDALFLLSLLRVPEQVVRHCRVVAQVAETLVQALGPFVPGLDAGLARTAGLLHDMARSCVGHAAVAQRILANLGLPRVGEIVGAHMALRADQAEAPTLTEEQLVYLADKLVAEDQVIGLEERTARTQLRHAGVHNAPEAMGVIGRRMGAAEVIQRRVEAILGRPLLEVLPRETPSSI